MPFVVKAPEFRGILFNSIEQYNIARALNIMREKNKCRELKSISINYPTQVELFVEIKRNSEKVRAIELNISDLRSKIEQLTQIDITVKELLKVMKKMTDQASTNKDGIPIGTKLYAVSTVKGTFPQGKRFELTVTSMGYKIGDVCYNSLSAAAEGVSGNRRNGWEWWKTMEGNTARKVFLLSN